MYYFNIISSLKHEVNIYSGGEREKFWKTLFRTLLLTVFIVLLTIIFFNFVGFLYYELDFEKPNNQLFKKIINNSRITTSILVIFSFFILLLTSKVARGLLFDYVLFFEIKNSTNSLYYLIKKIQKLHDNVAYSFENEKGILNVRSGLGFRNKINIPEMKEPQIELEIINILERCRNTGFDIIFVFDELDKISLNVTDYNAHQEIDSAKQRITNHFEDETIDEYVYRRKKRVDSLLASLKTLITTGEARFFFIAGRDMLDSYQSEKGSTSSLYESLFNLVFEVPSFFSDDSDQDRSHMHSMIEVYVCSKLLKQHVAKKYWFANEICGEIINNLDENARSYYTNELKEIRIINDKIKKKKTTHYIV